MVLTYKANIIITFFSFQRVVYVCLFFLLTSAINYCRALARRAGWVGVVGVQVGVEVGVEVGGSRSQAFEP